MKHVRHLLVAALTVFLAAVLAVPAFAKAGDTHTISVPSTDTHTYDVYQILTGDLSSDKTTLSNVVWGSSVNDQTDGKINGKTAAEFAESLNGMSGVDAVAEVAKYFTTGAKKVGQVTSTSSLTAVEGYYVMVDVTDLTTTTTQNDTKALNVIKLNGDVEVDKKWSTSTDTKTIVADTLGDEGNTYDPGTDNNNVSVGDTITYNIDATVPDNADRFKPGTFFFVITDKLSNGLTFTPNSIVVKDGNGTVLTAGTNYTVQYNVNGNTFEIGLINAASYKGQTINVQYSAVLNENAKIGDEGNPNTSTVQFSNDPNKTYDGSPEDENHPGFPDSTQNVPTGVTPESETITYTTGIEIKKVDENGKVLTGAGFTITGDATEIVLVSSEEFAEAANGEYYGLNNGTYTTDAPVTADYMKEAEAGAKKGYVVAEANYEGTDTITVGGTVYRPVKDGDTGTVYILVEANADQYDGKRYNKTVTYTQKNTKTTGVTATAEVGADGVVTFNGLGAGVYTIEETTVPDSYNKMPNLTVTISFDNTKDPKWTDDAVSGAAYDKTDGVYKLTIENEKGTTLPETGGMGTTILYIVGGCMIAAGVVMFLTKRRMASLEQ